MQHRRLWPVLLAVLLIVMAVSPAFAQDDGTDDAFLSADASTIIPGRYIVAFKDGAGVAAVDAAIAEAQVAAAATEGSGAVEVHYRYESALLGFAASMPASSLEALKKNPNVVIIEPDQVITLSATQSPATWGLDRIDQRNLPLNNSYSYANTGAGVKAYIIDTGILFSHSEFGSRAVSGYDAVDGGTGR